MITINEALRNWPGRYGRYYTPHLPQYPIYNQLYWLIKQSRVQTGKQGRCLTFDLDALVDHMAACYDIKQLRRVGALLVFPGKQDNA